MRKLAKHILLVSGATIFALSACGDSPNPNDGFNKAPYKPGSTDFETEEYGGTGDGDGDKQADAGARNSGAGGSGAGAPTADESAKAAPPGGRLGDVEEADIYRMSGTNLFYLNTYRGFIIYDVADPKNPKRLGRLPVYGYPVEMFVDGNVVYALLRDALYLTEHQGKLQFERHNVSQLVAIDVADPENPRMLETLDITGQLREGVSRKIDNTIYVVSHVPQSYHWGWRSPGAPAPKEQAWVYSFNVADARAPKMVQRLPIFEGGSVSETDPATGVITQRYFSGVTISATSNALMVVENWQVTAYAYGDTKRCGSYNSSQKAIVSLIDISDPNGKINLHARFETAGQLGDQFKMTYVNDEVAKTGTFFGIFARQEWTSGDCNGSSEIVNTIESWDVTNRDNPVKLSSLDFGKPNETVRGSAFDVSRKVAYAITARQIDPLYAISLADRNNLKVLSAIDGLSGDMNVFRLVGGGQYLLAVGQDQSSACTGFQETQGWASTKQAVSIIDVRDLSAIRLVQRQCVAIKNASWSGSAINWNRDQAHKMLGMHADGDLNVITVPVYYSKKSDDNDWWYYRYETAVGMMTWDLSRYDPTKPPTAQTVIQNFGTFVHPNGEVKRSIVFRHPTLGRRMMINLSDTYVSIANIEDMNNPQLDANIEVAPYHAQLYRFGNHIVEYVQPTRYGYWNANHLSEFRVKVAGGDLESKPAVATFAVGQVQNVIKHGNLLVLFRQLPSDNMNPYYYNYNQYTEALVYDLTNPAQPRMAGRVKVPSTMPYYRFYCGPWWGGYWFGETSTWATTSAGIVFLRNDYYTTVPQTYLVLLDLRNPTAPAVHQQTINLPNAGDDSYGYYTPDIIGDPVASSGFYITARVHSGERKLADGSVFRVFKDFAQRWDVVGTSMVAKESINLPGRLIRTWSAGGGRRFLVQDDAWRHVTEPNWSYYRSHMRLSLLRQISINKKPVAELLDSRVFLDLSLGSLVLDGDKLIINARRGYNYYYEYPVSGGDVATSSDSAKQPNWELTSDRLMIFDMAQNTLRTAYDEPTRMFNVQLMGTHKDKLFVNLSGDGILIVDISDPSKPFGQRFVRTLGYATHIEFAGDDAYVAAGHFGVYRLDLAAQPDFPPEVPLM